MSKKVLIVESRYYEDIANLLLEATIEQLNYYNVKFIARKSNVSENHELNLDDVKIASNIIQYIFGD